ncbi:unnamed protein product [Owenia fusiformis]|uniref:Uncharacterized protein n=1 Tax=Owenia fusiformis TaxID=6347 RepID=A0A8S4N4W8_OWEFU|nr:unnamed protein product [Owenia fusiformis]
MEYLDVIDPDVEPIKEPLKESYISIASKHPLSRLTLNECMQELKHDDEEAFVFMNPDASRHSSITYKRWVALSENLAVSFDEIGVRPGDMVVVCVPNCEEMVVCVGGLLHCAAVPVFLTFGLKSGEDIVEQIKDVNAKVAIMYVGDDASMNGLMTKLFTEVLSGKTDPRMPELRHVILIGDSEIPKGALHYRALITEKSDEEKLKIGPTANEHVTMDSPCWINLTSGSTGKPKYCVINHKTAINSSSSLTRRLSNGPDRDIHFNDRPLSWAGGSHCFGFALAMHEKIITINACFTVGNSNADNVLKMLQNEKVTKALLMPYLLYDVSNMAAAQVKAYDLSSLKVVWTSGQRIEPDLLDRVQSLIPIAFSIMFAQTETLMISATFPSGDYKKQNNTTGYGFPNIEIAIKDKANEIVPINTEGEICVRGYSNFIRYLNNEEKTRETKDADGWVHTGDIGTLTPYGYVTVVGRIKEFIKRGTVIVHPGGIEKILHQHPAVMQAYVIGVPDPRLYEELCACIQVRDDQSLTKNEIKEWCNGVFSDRTADGLSKVPKYFIIMEDLPILGNGKIDRLSLKKKAIRELQL